MNFRHVVFQGNKAIAGFNDFISACNFKEMMTNINRIAGYKDHFQITNTKAFFRFLVVQNDRTIAGFENFNNACNFKEMMTSINRQAGYNDRYRIIPVNDN